jgi:predicted dehydrogenase
MKPLNFAILGPHNRGRIALHAHRPAEGLRVVALCASHLENLEDYRERCGPDIILSTDYRKIVTHPGVDVVFVCTPDHLHAEHAIAALDAGKHVFLEKPMATTIADCDRIASAADRSRGKLYVGHNMRFFPVVRKMHELIAQGMIGRVEAIWCRHFISYGGDAYFKDWHSERKYTNSLLLQKGAHDIDVIHYLGDGYTKRVVGMGKLSVYNEVTDRRKPEEPGVSQFDPGNWPPLSQKNLSPVIDVEDHSMILMQLANGVQASYLQCHYTPDDCRNYTIIGTGGRIENYGDMSLPESWATVHLWNRRMGYQEHGNEVFRIPDTAGGHGGADPQMIQDFLNFLQDEPSNGATIQDARMAVATGCLGALSLREGSIPKDVPPAPVLTNELQTIPACLIK